MSRAFSDAKSLIDSAQTIAVAGHQNPDGDCYGSILGLGLALRAAGKSVDFLAEDSFAHFDYMPGFSEIQMPDPTKSYDLFIRVDIGDTPRMGSSYAVMQNSAKSLNFDHHLDNDGLCSVTIQKTDASSTCEILANFLYETGLPVPAEAATCLLAGLITDSNRYLYDTSGPETLRTGARLMESGADAQRIFVREYQSQDPMRLAFEGEVVRNAIFLHGGKVVLANLTQELLQPYGIAMPEAEGVVDTLRSLDGVEIAVILKEQEPLLQKISFRSKVAYDVATLARQFGGGGHIKAAGASMDGDNATNFAKLQAFLEGLTISL